MTDPNTVAELAGLAPLSLLERGLGTVIGTTRATPLDRTSGTSARAALEDVLREALARPPCVISFSGGRDSSTILAVATLVARRDGLPLPVPVSLCFPDCASSDEDEWQTLLVRHLQLPDWQRLSFHDELDIVGPVAAKVLIDKGLLWPFNAYFHVPIMAAARGGSVLSGVFGDELLGNGWAWRRENQVLQRRSKLRAADPLRLALSLSPRPVRRRFLAARRARAGSAPQRPAWITPQAFAAVLDGQARAAAAESLSFRHSVQAALWPLRSRVIGGHAMRMLAADYDVSYRAPFADARFVSALVAERGWRMFADRTEATRWLAGDLLPSELSGRATKAWFDMAFFNRYARAFAREWTGRGVDPDFVDPDELRRIWLEEDEPDARTYALLQQAWLAESAEPES